MANQISGNVVAANARLRLRTYTSIQQGGVEVTQRIYSDASGNFVFTAVPAGTYQIVADLNECSTAPYNSGYRFPSPVIVTMDAAGDNITINLQPVALNAPNPPNGSR